MRARFCIIVLMQSLLKVVSTSHIERTVGAFEYVDEVGHAWQIDQRKSSRALFITATVICKILAKLTHAR